ncbi:MAG: hypothetical protein KatS3mg011_1894 [Acidimicrobiia bacterium]|nr:MAG: hypothetical protein KatS3mg011_1894 [Acidimicrobiia bacterium]
MGRDVTEERNTARRLEELIRAKDEFVAAVSHELRTPLTAVVGMALELRDNESAFGEDERRDLVELIAEQAQEVAHIVEDLLVAARADTDTISLVVRPVDLGEAVDAAVRALPTDARSRVANKAWGVVRADPGRVRQILRNLLTNAIRYGGPNIEVRTTEQGGFSGHLGGR